MNFFETGMLLLGDKASYAIVHIQFFKETSVGSGTWQRYGTKERIKLGVDTFLTQFEAEIRNRSDWRITTN